MYGYPFGVIPRLLMAWMATEAVATKDPVLELGTSAMRFMRMLDMPSDGRAYARLREQIQRLAGASILVTDLRPNGLSGGTFQFAEEWNLWWTPKDQQDSLFPSTITLSEKFFRSILESPVPIDLRALSVLRRSGGGGLPIDISAGLGPDPPGNIPGITFPQPSRATAATANRAQAKRAQATADIAQIPRTTAELAEGTAT